MKIYFLDVNDFQSIFRKETILLKLVLTPSEKIFWKSFHHNAVRQEGGEVRQCFVLCTATIEKGETIIDQAYINMVFDILSNMQIIRHKKVKLNIRKRREK